MKNDPRCLFCQSEMAKCRCAEERQDERSAEVHFVIWEYHLKVEHPVIYEALKASEESREEGKSS